MIFALTVRQGFLIRLFRWQYFKRFWTYIDLTLISCSYAAFSMFLYRLYEAEKIMSSISDKSPTHSFRNLQMLASWDDLMCSLLAFCACLGSFKFFRILEHNRSIHILTSALRHGFTSIFMFATIFILFCIAFVQSAYLIFNQEVIGISTFLESIMTCFLVLLGKFQLTEMLESNAIFTVIFFVSFNVFMVMVLLNMFFTLLTDAFTFAKVKFLILNFLIFKLLFILRWNNL